MRRERGKELVISRRGISIERGRQMSDPRPVELLALEHTCEDGWLGVRDVAKRVAADVGVGVDH
jgi:hypothetical protein